MHLCPEYPDQLVGHANLCLELGLMFAGAWCAAYVVPVAGRLVAQYVPAQVRGFVARAMALAAPLPA